MFAPTKKSEAGYRLYDDKALETLQQILFFREFDIPLKEIKAVMENPALDRNQILKMQKKMLTAKKEHLERLIAGIDDILKGDNQMDFAIFSQEEIGELFQTMLDHMPKEMVDQSVQEFGSVEKWKKHYMDVVSSEKMQKNYAKVVEWYGSKEQYLSVANNPVSKEVADSYSRRIEEILEKMNSRRDCPIDSFEIRQLVGEYGFVMEQFCQVKEVKGMMLSIARSYRDEWYKTTLDEKYGAGAAEFFARAIEEFYNR